MEKELKTNNSKKLIIGVSILFCIIILIIGGSIAYFTQSDTKPIDDIVSVDQVSLAYSDSNNNYVLGDLIPINQSDIDTAYNREDDKKCKDDNGYNVCSIYRFIISNTSDVMQKLVIKMIPTLNSFHNLKYMIYEINNGVSTNIKKYQSLTYDNKTPITLFSDLKLNNRSSKTYEIVFYILNNPNESQSEQDAGKKFGANISINSVTTGEYVSKDIGESCYKVMEISDESSAIASPDTKYYSETMSEELFERYKGTYILTEFYGIDEENKKPVEGCGVTQDENGFYSVFVPSTLGGKEISTLGNSLFQGFTGDNFNEKSKIMNIEMDNEIEVIEDGIYLKGTFLGVGLYSEEQDKEPNFHSEGLSEYSVDFNIKLSKNLKIIGAQSFLLNNIKTISIPSNINAIGNNAFGGDIGAKKLTKVTFELDENGNSNLKTIKEYAFDSCNLTYTDSNNPLVIPSSVTTIGRGAFNSYVSGTELNSNNHNLKYIRFNGTLTAGNTDWYTSIENGGVTTLVP